MGNMWYRPQLPQLCRSLQTRYSGESTTTVPMMWTRLGRVCGSHSSAPSLSWLLLVILVTCSKPSRIMITSLTTLTVKSHDDKQFSSSRSFTGIYAWQGKSDLKINTKQARHWEQYQWEYIKYVSNKYEYPRKFGQPLKRPKRRLLSKPKSNFESGIWNEFRSSSLKCWLSHTRLYTLI